MIASHVTKVHSLPADVGVDAGAIAECACGWGSRVYTEDECKIARKRLPRVVHMFVTPHALAEVAGQVHRLARSIVEDES